MIMSPKFATNCLTNFGHDIVKWNKNMFWYTKTHTQDGIKGNKHKSSQFKKSTLLLF